MYATYARCLSMHSTLTLPPTPSDGNASRAIIAMRRPTDSILPQWMAEDSRAYSTALYKQGLRTRGRGKGDKDKGKDGKGKSKGAQGSQNT